MKHVDRIWTMIINWSKYDLHCDDRIIKSGDFVLIRRYIGVKDVKIERFEHLHFMWIKHVTPVGYSLMEKEYVRYRVDAFKKQCGYEK